MLHRIVCRQVGGTWRQVKYDFCGPHYLHSNLPHLLVALHGVGLLQVALMHGQKCVDINECSMLMPSVQHNNLMDTVLSAHLDAKTWNCSLSLQGWIRSKQHTKQIQKSHHYLLGRS